MPINPQEIRLPVPQPPSERLLAAVEAFYSPPSHDRPRDRSVEISSFVCFQCNDHGQLHLEQLCRDVKLTNRDGNSQNV